VCAVQEQVHPVLEEIPVLCVLHLTQTSESCCRCLYVHGLGVGPVSIDPEHTPPGGQDERIVRYTSVYISSWNRLLVGSGSSCGNCLTGAASLDRKGCLRPGMEKCGSIAWTLASGFHICHPQLCLGIEDHFVLSVGSNSIPGGMCLSA
jgi:hypothetical protein